MGPAREYIRYLLLITAVCVNIANCGAGRYGDWTPPPYVGRHSMPCRKTYNPVRMRAQAMSQSSSYRTQGCNNCEQQCMSNCGRPFTDRCQHEEHILGAYRASNNQVRIDINLERRTLSLPVRLVLLSYQAMRYEVYVPKNVTIDSIILSSYQGGTTVRVIQPASGDYVFSTDDHSSDELHGVKVYRANYIGYNSYARVVSELDLNCVLSYTRRYTVSSWSLRVGVAISGIQHCPGIFTGPYGSGPYGSGLSGSGSGFGPPGLLGPPGGDGPSGPHGPPRRPLRNTNSEHEDHENLQMLKTVHHTYSSDRRLWGITMGVGAGVLLVVLIVVVALIMRRKRKNNAHAHVNPTADNAIANPSYVQDAIVAGAPLPPAPTDVGCSKENVYNEVQPPSYYDNPSKIVHASALPIKTIS